MLLNLTQLRHCIVISMRPITQFIKIAKLVAFEESVQCRMLRKYYGKNSKCVRACAQLDGQNQFIGNLKGSCIHSPTIQK